MLLAASITEPKPQTKEHRKLRCNKMINFNDLDNAEKNIDNMFKLRDNLINSSPYLIDMKARLQWYKKAISEIPEQAETFYSLIETPVQSILSITPANLEYSSITGATGSFYSVSGDTRQVITKYGNQHFPLITEYENLKKTEIIIDEITDVISGFREDLKLYNPKQLLIDAKNAYSQWKAGAIDNSNLASETRAFQDIFKSCLRDAWVATANLRAPNFSWNKMAEILGKNGGGCKKLLLNIKGAEEDFHSEFSEILKKTKEVSNEQMEKLFKEYIEHLYSIINLVDINLMK